MKCFLFILFLLFKMACSAQLLRSSLPVPYTTAGTYSQHFTDAFSFTKNQAALSRVSNITAGIYSERRFMLSEAKAFSAALSFPCSRGAAGLAADYTGFTDYNESHLGVAYGMSLGAKVDIGAQFNYHRISLAGYGSASALNFEIGTIFRLSEKISAGCHIYNPAGGRFSKNNEEKLSSVYSFGLGYEASDKLFLGSEIIREENNPVDFNIVVHYAFEKQFFVRGGIATATGNYFAGTGIFLNSIRLDVAADWHPRAGLTPSLLMIFVITKSKTE